MVLQRITHSGAAPPTNLLSSITATALSFGLTSSTGYPTGSAGPFVLDIDSGQPTEEKVLCSSLSGGTITVAPGGRGWDGTIAVAHTPGTALAPNVTHIFSSSEADDANSHIYNTSRDDHGQYALITGARAAVAYAFMNADQSVPTPGAYTQAQLNTIYIYTGFPVNCFNPSTHLFTAPYAGMYRINAHAGFSTGAPGSIADAVSVQPTQNGNPLSFSPGSSFNPAYNLWMVESTVIASCQVGDTLGMTVLSAVANTLKGIQQVTFATFELIN